jgi:hypothetical protein
MRSSSPASRHLLIYLFLAAVTILAGLALRRLNLHLPVAVVKYGGSALWAMMIYWLVAAVRPAWKPAETGFVSALIAALVEFFKLYHSSGLDAFRRTLAGTLLLGRYFSLLDVGVYCIAIACVAWIDSRVIRRG